MPRHYDLAKGSIPHVLVFRQGLLERIPVVLTLVGDGDLVSPVS